MPNKKNSPLLKNLLLITCVLAAAAGLLIASRGLPKRVNAPAEATPQATEKAQEEFDLSQLDLSRMPEAFLVLSITGHPPYEPIPVTDEERLIPYEWEGHRIVMAVGPEGIRMAESSCENQDCVEQGLVTLENRDTRPLGNMIICLPNQVTLELYNREEIVRWALGMSGGADEEP